MRRYRFLTKGDVYEALNRLRDAFLAAKNGEEVNKIINGILTTDEKLKIGRRILVAECLKNGMNLEEITDLLKVGKTTISLVSKQMEEFPDCFVLIEERKIKVEKEYKSKKYMLIGGSEKIFKTRVYSGFTRKEIKR